MTVESLKLLPAPKDTMLVAARDGRLYLVDFSEYPHLDDPTEIDWAKSKSKIVLGKLQYVRGRWITLEEIEFENVTQPYLTQDNCPQCQIPDGLQNSQVTVFGSDDGKNITSTSHPYTLNQDGRYMHTGCRVTAKNFQVQLTGIYNINTITLTFHNHGKR